MPPTSTRAGSATTCAASSRPPRSAGIGLGSPCRRSVGSASATFHFTGITHAKDAPRGGGHGRDRCCPYQLLVEFYPPATVPAIGSSAHYVLSAWMPSGLRVDIVARAGIFDSPEAREDAQKLVAA